MSFFARVYRLLLFWIGTYAMLIVGIETYQWGSRIHAQLQGNLRLDWPIHLSLMGAGFSAAIFLAFFCYSFVFPKLKLVWTAFNTALVASIFSLSMFAGLSVNKSFQFTSRPAQLSSDVFIPLFLVAALVSMRMLANRTLKKTPDQPNDMSRFAARFRQSRM